MANDNPLPVLLPIQHPDAGWCIAWIGEAKTQDQAELLLQLYVKGTGVDIDHYEFRVGRAPFAWMGAYRFIQAKTQAAPMTKH